MTSSWARSLLALPLFFATVAASERTVIPLWPEGAPGFESRRNEPEKVISDRQTNIHNPTLTVFLPEKKNATGVAVVIAPGGGHAHLADVHEGYRVAEWLADHGVAGCVLKYRLAKDRGQDGKSPYTVDEHALADVQRALQLVRSRAAEWQINSGAIGVLGFSAGGELAILAGTRTLPGSPSAKNSIERVTSRPDFVGLMYPGRTERTDFKLTQDLPPFFIAAGADDRMVDNITVFFQAARKAGVKTEFHIYAGIGHGFGIRDVNPPSVAAWPDHFLAWLSAVTRVRAAGTAI